MEWSVLSRTVSRILRHEPWLYELELDADGWVDVEALLRALRQASPNWQDITESDLVAMVRRSRQQRHELANGRIRAMYGHSIPGRIVRPRVAPPPVLFHGTAEESWPTIQRDGLWPMQRQYVHLSSDYAKAIAVGSRKSRHPLVLIVDAANAWKTGVAFYEGSDAVWLADRVPAMFLRPYQTNLS